MIPLHLHISGFLSYREAVDLDFTGFDFACISGANGAGKSSLLDSITWSLFGEARGKSSDVINLHPTVKAAEVALTFQHEENTYRVQRTLPRSKNTLLEFQVLSHSKWKPLTEKTTRETQARIEQTLRLDFDTFVNASFFLQGKADQFTQQNATKRKEVLSNILGLEMWEHYKDRTAEKRKALEREVGEIDGRIREIDAELAEEDLRKARLAELDSNLKQLTTTRTAQESILENIRRNAALIDEQRKMTGMLLEGLERARSALAGLEARLADKQADHNSYANLIQRAREIESAYKAWQKSRKELEEWDSVASRFREYEKDRTPLVEQIAVERARLEQEAQGLHQQETSIGDQLLVMSNLGHEIERVQQAMDLAEEKIKEREQINTQVQSGRERQAALRVENEQLGTLGKELNERIEKLESTDSPTCPLCGQELTFFHRQQTLEQITAERDEMREKYKDNQKESADLAKQITNYELQIAKLASAENERVRYASEISQLTERMETLRASAQDWESAGKKRLKEVEKLLEAGKYASAEQKQLAKLDKELEKLGYDVSAHESARAAEVELRAVEEEHINLKSAKEVSRQIESEILNLKSEIHKRESEIKTLETDYRTARTNLEAAEAGSPDLDEAERELFRLREAENKIRGELGGAQQRVSVLDTQRERKVAFEKECEELQKQIARYRTLERAFGKDGVPALLIEQALPQIEDKANELLDRLSDGQMSIRFATQTEYKDKRRDDLRETLDIQISDTAGIRSYEMYSGGEAFRVNFAIRLALSKILAQRKGARLQTLVIDEGFGSQDTQGRQRLIEAINLVKNDFAKILVITHLDELKDAFPTRIEVEKSDRGSMLRVV
ncbi:MAG TPA: SMC family ATPase [Anaerolineales bacterium]|nr:SMC family ATPase [Anaerolineales bacterium]